MNLDSRITITNIVAIIVGAILYFTGTGAIQAALSGFLIFGINGIVVLIDKFKMTNDKWILGIAILGLIASLFQYQQDTPVFDWLSQNTVNTILAMLLLVLRQFSEELPTAKK